jgi:putative pyruvate formate lyase activating enzyme
MSDILEKCTLCPHKCNVNRRKKQVGRCKANDDVKIALVSTHNYEEPCISKIHGSGTIFFSNCNLKCVFCQNYEISQSGIGEEYSIEELANIMLKQQEKGVNNINLVTPTIYAYQIIQAIKIAKQKGLNIPIIYNTSGYENLETLKMLDGYIDIYLPDFKYYDNDVASKYSNIENYFEYTSEAIKEMYRQVGNPVFDNDGILKKGLIIRHMILPNYVSQTKNILNWIRENIGKEAYVSIMAQYFPSNIAWKYEKINRKINRIELKMVEKYLFESGIENGYIQKIGKCEEKYVPNFIQKID